MITIFFSFKIITYVNDFTLLHEVYVSQNILYTSKFKLLLNWRLNFNLIGKDSVDQKGKFIGMDQGLTSMGAVVHLYNFENIRNRTETPLFMQALLTGAEQAGYMDGIIFLNYE